MKRLLLFTLYLCVAQFYPKPLHPRPQKTFQSVSLIDDMGVTHGVVKLRLMEFPFPVRCPQSDSLVYKVRSAYLNGLPLKFFICGDSLCHIASPSRTEYSAYNRLLIPLLPVAISSQNYTPFNPLNLTRSFASYFYRTYQLPMSQIDQSACCEIRAGVVARYLRNTFNLTTYKLFFKGRLHWRNRSVDYNWSNHVVNLIPCLIGNTKQLLIFDPFDETPIRTYEEYIHKMIRLGSIIQDTYITHEDILCLNFPSKKGISDIGFINSDQLMTDLIRQLR